MKFIHTADWQLGMVFGQAQQRADALRQARLDVVKSVLALADREKADFVLAAGDLLEDNRIFASFIEQMAGVVSNSKVPVYLLPGNHDPLTQDSPYIRRSDLFKRNAMVLRSHDPIAVAGGTLYPCPAYTRTSREDPTAWIPARGDEDGIRVGIAHGSVDTPTPTDFPIPGKAAKLRGLDYLALGHFHGTRAVGEETWYSGTPEPTCFGEPPGHALVVELLAPGKPPRVRQVSVATYQWNQLDADVYDGTDVQRLISKVAAFTEPQTTLLRVRARGSLTPAWLAELDSGLAEVRSRFFLFKLHNLIVPTVGDRAFRHPLLREMAEVLTAKAAVEAESGSPEAVEASAARRGLSILSTLVKEAGFKEDRL